jgi:hypothetical protein
VQLDLNNAFKGVQNVSTYKVSWFIDIEADDPLEAARSALGIMQDLESIATVFTVQSPSDAVCVDAVSGDILPSDFPGYWAGLP